MCPIHSTRPVFSISRRTRDVAYHDGTLWHGTGFKAKRIHASAVVVAVSTGEEAFEYTGGKFAPAKPELKFARVRDFAVGSDGEKWFACITVISNGLFCAG